MSNYYYYFYGDIVIVCTACVKDLGVSSDSKLHLHRHVGYLCSHALYLLELIHFVIQFLSSGYSKISIYCLNSAND